MLNGINFYKSSLFEFIVNFLSMMSHLFFVKLGLRDLHVLLRQIYFLGFKALFLIIISSCFIGLVLSFQSYVLLEKFSATSSLGAIVGLSLFRELGPVLTALLFVGSIGTSVTSEIALMKATDQISALRVIAVNPVSRIIFPRFWAGIIVFPLLVFIFINFSLVFSNFLYFFLGNSVISFWDSLSSNIDFYLDIKRTFIKSFLFGFIIMFVSLFNGYYSVPTPEGLVKSVNKTVVFSSLFVLFADFLLTFLMIGEI